MNTLLKNEAMRLKVRQLISSFITASKAHAVFLVVVPAFVPPSFDDTLHALSLKHKVKYKASTSSITGLLSHVYQVLGHAYLRGHVCCVDDVVCSPLPSPGCFVTVYRWPPAIWAEPGPRLHSCGQLLRCCAQRRCAWSRTRSIALLCWGREGQMREADAGS